MGNNKSRWSMVVITAMIAVACSTAAPSTAPATQAPATQAPASQAAASEAPPASEAPGEPNTPAVPTGYDDLDLALGADQPFKGKRVTIQTQWIGGEGANFDATVADFETATGIDVVQESIASQHEVVLKTRIDGNTPPDLAFLAQPSSVVVYGEGGKTTDVATFMDTAKLNSEFETSLPNVSDDAGHIFGIPFKSDVKSNIWYPIKAFEAAGYEVPTTWDELKALSAKIVADGNGSPWCLGILDGAATGWIATDWLEDVMLRTAGIDAYNQWIAGDLKFDSPEVRAALDVLAEEWFTDGYVYGGSEAITATDRLEGWDPMFAPDNNWDGFTPGCWMHRQSTWIGPDFFPDKRASTDPTYESMYQLGEDIGFFYLPPIDEAQGTPVLVSGDTLMVLTPPTGDVRPEVKAVAEFLATPYGPKAWIDIGSGISPNSATPTDWYQSYKQGLAAEFAANATAVGFDASDLMPPEVGNGTFWTGMVEWIDAKGTNTDTVLQNIDASWPQ